MSKELKRVLIYIFSIVLAGIVLSLGVDFLNRRVTNVTLKEEPQFIDVNELR